MIQTRVLCPFIIAAARGRIRACRILFFLGGLALAAPTVVAQQPDTLRVTLHNPGTTPQLGARQGFSVAIDGDRVVVGAPYDDLGGTDSGAVKVYQASTGALVQVLANPTPAPNDAFGYSVSISGTRVVVGAPFDDSGAVNAGSVYVFDLAGATPATPVATFNNPTPAPNDEFGHAVAVSGLLVVVGVPDDDAGAANAGTVHVFDLATAQGAGPLVTINNPSPIAGDAFGYSVAADGNRLVIGARWVDAGSLFNSGRAYTYQITGAIATWVATFSNPSPGQGDSFGTSVGISGTRVVVGAQFDSSGAQSTGRAYVYDLGGASPAVPSVTLNNPTPAVGDHFGRAVAISGVKVVVGAFQRYISGPNAGRAFVFDLSKPTPTSPEAILDNPSPASYDEFGLAVAVSGTRVIVGSHQDDTVAEDAGTAYAYEISGPTPTVPAFLLNSPSPAVGDEFGTSVAVSGTRVVVGAPRDDTGATDAGSAYVFDLSGATPTVPVATLRNPSPAAGDLFGISVGISGTRLVVGAPRDDTGATDAGSAYLYDLAGATPTIPLATMNNPTPVAGDNFASSVAIDGTWVVVGAPYDDTAAGNAGSAYVYFSLGANTALLVTIPNPSPALNDYFGWAVAVSGTRAMVGAPRDNTGANAAGSAYVYNLSGGSATIPATTLSSTTSFERFGSAVAINGNRAVVGAPNNTGGAVGAGRARVYDLTGASPTVPVATLNKPTPALYDTFGSFVAISGTRTTVGALNSDGFSTFGENAFVFELAGAAPTTPVVTLTNPSAIQNDIFAWSGALDGTLLVVGAPLAEGASVDRGAAYVFGPNRAPTGLSLANNTIAEHRAAGTLVGYFVPEDPDGGDVLLCSLATGTGGTDNARFAIANGTNLLATTSFDYETQNSFSIRVRATDRAGLFVEGSFTILVSDIEELPPSILAGPASVTNVVGGAASFIVSAAGTAPLSYQWRFEGADIGSANEAAFQRTGLTRTHSGRYSVAVSNAFGNVVSPDALLVVGGAAQRLQAPIALGAGQFRVTFSDADGGALFPWDQGILQAQGTSSLPGGWVNLTNEIVIDNGVGYVEFTATNDPPHQFFRIKVQ